MVQSYIPLNQTDSRTLSNAYGTGMGANLITISSLCDVCSDSEIITDSFDFQDSLKKLQEHVPYVIQKVLGYKHSNQNLLEYNQTETGHREPYRILVIADYPRTLNEVHYRILDVIIKNAKKAGIFVIMSYDTTCELTDYSGKCSPFVELLERMTVIYEKDDAFHFKNIPNEEILRRFKLRLDPGIINNTDDVLMFIEEREDTSSADGPLMLIDYLPSQTDWWSDSSADGLSIPFGVSSGNDVANLTITQVNGQNVAVVVGVSGSGKSVLLSAPQDAIMFRYDNIVVVYDEFIQAERYTYYDNHGSIIGYGSRNL